MARRAPDPNPTKPITIIVAMQLVRLVTAREHFVTVCDKKNQVLTSDSFTVVVIIIT